MLGQRNSSDTGAVEPCGVRRSLSVAALVLTAVVVLVPAGYVASVALASFASVPVPPWCSSGTSHLPGATSRIPGTQAAGTPLVRDATTSVVLRADYGKTPFVAQVDVVNRAEHRVVRSYRFDNDVLAVAIQGGTVFLYDNALLSAVSAATGRDNRGMVRIDNYRALYTQDGATRMQTTAVISLLGFDHRPLTQVHLRFATVAQGCLLSSS